MYIRIGALWRVYVAQWHLNSQLSLSARYGDLALVAWAEVRHCDRELDVTLVFGERHSARTAGYVKCGVEAVDGHCEHGVRTRVRPVMSGQGKEGPEDAQVGTSRPFAPPSPLITYCQASKLTSVDGIDTNGGGVSRWSRGRAQAWATGGAEGGHRRGRQVEQRAGTGVGEWV